VKRRFLREAQLRWRNAQEQRARVDWPRTSGDGSVSVVAVSYNTLTITLQMIFSVYRVLNAPPEHLIVVDNGSTDGSAAFLAELDRLNLITLVSNTSSNQHGPGLNLGLDAARVLNPQASYVWVLDSDVFVARGDALSASRQYLVDSGRALVGPLDRSAPTIELPEGYAHVSCLLFDPRRVWGGRTAVFLDAGDPGRQMQKTMRELGDPAGFFPFYDDGYLVHLGRASLMQVAATGETTNPLYNWAVTHNVHHYGNYPNGPQLHQKIGLEMQSEVGHLTPASFADACRRKPRINLGA